MTEEKNNKNKYAKRRVFLINKPFQLRFITYMLIPNFICIFFFFLAVNVYFSNAHVYGVDNNLEPNHPFFRMLEVGQEQLFVLLTISALFSLLFILVWGLFISHKIAGPFYRMTNFFNDKEVDHFQRNFNFRPGDFFLEIPMAINNWMDRYHRTDSSTPLDSNEEIEDANEKVYEDETKIQ